MIYINDIYLIYIRFFECEKIVRKKSDMSDFFNSEKIGPSDFFYSKIL